MVNYYNEIDEYAAQWLRNLIAAGHIAPGDVDTRSIEDVHPDDLRPYTQCHFFAGIGVWSAALRRAGWPDDRSIWTGSCPCQPFSAAGRGDGFNDERHLWPAWHWLIAQRAPAIILGEQVASRDAEPWIDLVSTDLEGLDYAVGALAFPSAGVGAPHIRDRLYWVAHASGARLEGRAAGTLGRQRATVERGCEAGGLGHAECERTGRDAGASSCAQGGAVVRPVGDDARPSGATIGLADAGNSTGQRSEPRSTIGGLPPSPQGPGPTNGHWRGADWLACRDGKWRPVEPGTFPLVDGAPARVGRLRAYGNAVNLEAAVAFIDAVVSSIYHLAP